MPFVLIIVGVLVAVGLGGYYFTGGNDVAATPDTPVTRAEDTAPQSDTPPQSQPETTTTVPNTPPSVATPAVPTTPTAPATVFKNGTYNVMTTYVAPSRTTHEVNVSLTIENDIVTDSTVTFSGETFDASSNHQKNFSEAYKTQVVGKSLEGISLSRVGGASLTTGAFNKALVEIAAEARS